MKRRIAIFCIAFIGFSIDSVFAQNEWTDSPTISLDGFVDAFYVYDFNKPQQNFRQQFLFNHNRHNEFNINLALLQLGVQSTKYRANLGLQAGTYPNDNYAAEPGVLKNIYEAYVGVSLNKTNNLWLDVGIFGSHLGFESPISLVNMTLTRSLVAESSPYFLSGAKLSYSPNEQWDLVAIVTNGWQRIERVPGNSLLSFGTQIVFKPNDTWSLNWSTFIGTDDPDATRRMRYFSNLFGQYQVNDKIALIAGVDFGMQQIANGSSTFNTWVAPVIIGQYIINEQWKTAVRFEYYGDEAGVIIPTGTANGFKTTGLSANIDFSPIPNLAWRSELRWFNSKDNVFEKDNGFVNSNFFIGTSLALQISTILSE
jgi:hypothetical protein